MLAKSLKQRFWKKVDETPGQGPWGDCLIWVAAADKYGRGRIRFQGVLRLAYRVAYKMTNPNWDISDSLQVCHHCDIPACVNSRHLFLGTQTDNMQDALKKGRLPLGDQCSFSKITEEQVLRIRVDKRKHQEIADDHLISRAMVLKIKSRKAWSHVGEVDLSQS